MLSGAGETSCGNTRCVHHDTSQPPPPLSTLELPFAYVEQGETKSALVKIVLCSKCVKKLMWKREKEREGSAVLGDDTKAELGDGIEGRVETNPRRRESDKVAAHGQQRRRSSRSLSPHARQKRDDARSRRRSPRPTIS